LLASLLREHGRGALSTQTMAPGESSEDSAPYLSTVADALLAMDYARHGFELNRTLRVIKMRGSPHDTHPYELVIEEGGLRVNRLAGPRPQRLSRSRLDLLYLTFFSALSGRVAQLVEHTTENRSVDSSILSPATSFPGKHSTFEPRRRRS
jgi:hypothetical protein